LLPEEGHGEGGGRGYYGYDSQGRYSSAVLSSLSAKILLLCGYKQSLLLFSFISLRSPVDLIGCVCVCVCERERERLQELVSVMVKLMVYFLLHPAEAGEEERPADLHASSDKEGEPRCFIRASFLSLRAWACIFSF
jgi:hypothetical protein